MSDTSVSYVSVQITADVASLTAGMKTASDAVASSSTSMTASLGQVVTYSASTQSALASLSTQTASMSAVNEAAGSSFSSLGDLILQKGSMMRREGRFANFIARDISSMGIASKAAAADIGGLVSAFAIGGGIGLAAESVKLIAEAFLHADEEVEKFGKDANDQMKRLKEQTDAILSGFDKLTVAERAFHDQLIPSLKEEADLKQKLNKANLDNSDAQEALEKARTEEEVTGALLRAAATQKEVDALNKKLAKQKEISAVASADVKAVDTKETVDTAQKQADQDKRIATEQNAWLMKAHASLLEGQEKLDADYEIELQQIHDNSNLSTEQKAARMSAALQTYAKADLDYRNKTEAQWNTDLQKWIDANIRAEAQAREAIKRLTDDQANYQEKRGKDVSKEQEKQMQETFALTKSIAGGIGTAFSGIVTGTESVGKAVVSMASVAIKALIDLAIKSVEASAVKAGGEAASAEAGIPIVGPALAIGAMVAMEALVLGLLSSIPSSAGGLDRVPQDTLAFIHKDETVMSAPLAETYRQAAANGGADGGGMHVHLHEHYGPGVIVDQASMDRHYSSPEFQHSVAAAIRAGRWRG